MVQVDFNGNFLEVLIPRGPNILLGWDLGWTVRGVQLAKSTPGLTPHHLLTQPHPSKSSLLSRRRQSLTRWTGMRVPTIDINAW